MNYCGSALPFSRFLLTYHHALRGKNMWSCSVSRISSEVLCGHRISRLLAHAESLLLAQRLLLQRPKERVASNTLLNDDHAMARITSSPLRPTSQGDAKGCIQQFAFRRAGVVTTSKRRDKQ